MPRRNAAEYQDVLAAIDVGTNAVRLELAQVLPDGSLETLHTERDPVRPGEGLFTSGTMKREVADRLLATLRRYSALCRRYKARVRAVATSAVREAKNKDEIVRRARREAQLNLEVVSGKEEARLICVGVLHGAPPLKRSLLFDIGGGSTEVAHAFGEHARDLWSIDLGAVRLTEMFRLSGEVPKKQLKLIRRYARDAASEALPQKLPGHPATALGSSGTIQAVVAYARAEGTGHATARQIEKAVEELADMDSEKRRKRFDPRRADIIVGGAVILDAVMRHFDLEAITAVDRGLREGVLLDLLKRRGVGEQDASLTEAALALGRRFAFGEAHARDVARLSLQLFDELAPMHQLPAASRPWLEAAALLHDIGHAINHQRHHKHTHYLILNADLPGLSDRERRLVACIARFHRRSPPDPAHEAMEGLTPSEVRIVRKASTMLRIADSLDASHNQPVVRNLHASVSGRKVTVSVKTRTPIDLELWNVSHEIGVFRDVFGRGLQVNVAR
jgi:exopolyphosphatase/guanosine-5'-triphosphate,3'-diphosphate pyrophosphatase